MNLPAKFRYMSQTYNIVNEELPSKKNSVRMGEVRWSSNEVGISTIITNGTNKDTLLHEIFHIIFGMYFSGGETEMIVDTATRGMLHVMRENPDIIKYLQKED